MLTGLLLSRSSGGGFINFEKFRAVFRQQLFSAHVFSFETRVVFAVTVRPMNHIKDSAENTAASHKAFCFIATERIHKIPYDLFILGYFKQMPAV